MGDHFERVEDASEFLSEYEEEKTQSAQTKNQIMELKESIMKEQKPTFMRNIKIVLFVFSIACAVVCFILVSSYNNYKSVNISYLNEVKFKYETRGYLAEYVIYFTALKYGFDKAVYEPILESTQDRLINSIENSLVS